MKFQKHLLALVFICTSFISVASDNSPITPSVFGCMVNVTVSSVDGDVLEEIETVIPVKISVNSDNQENNEDATLRPYMKASEVVLIEDKLMAKVMVSRETNYTSLSVTFEDLEDGSEMVIDADSGSYTNYITVEAPALLFNNNWIIDAKVICED